ncbi:hypothetical protein PWG11_17955 (plasmid) [Proteus mirabilis]|uniref:hypothetical protein n=1 Tax=Proteus mirabilis TaxID=584 RepID=UPI0038F77D43
MVELYSNFFSSLRKENIFFCSWKSNHELQKFLAGDGDLDLYISYVDKLKFENVCLRFNFKKVKSYVSDFPFVEHYIGYDIETKKLVHLHVYFKIVTGESNSKNYVLPLDLWIKNNISNENEIPTLKPDAQLIIFLLRFYLKFGTILGSLLLIRDKQKYLQEWKSLGQYSFDKTVVPDFIPVHFMHSILDIYENGSFLAKLSYSLKLKVVLHGYKRMSFIRHSFFKLINTIKRVFNKILTNKKKNFETGRLISICGLDGSGKSTAVTNLSSFYSQKFSTKVIHMGRPSPTFLTFPIWIALRCAERVKRSPTSKVKSVEEYIPSNHVSFISAFRYACLAYERYRVFKRAYKYVENGFIVVSDRYPSHNYGKMDSPRIIKDNNRSIFYCTLHKIEERLYNYIQPSDITFHLYAPVETAIERNNLRNKALKETENEIKARFLVNSDLTFKTDKYVKVDATQSIEDVKNELLLTSWEII